jgi:hypothetical protein
VTWGAGSAFTWTFDGGANTDPTFVFTSAVLPTIATNSTFIFPNGTTANPSATFAGQTGTGWSWGNELSINNLKASTGGALVASFSTSYGLGLYSGQGLNFSGSNSAGTHDAFIRRAAAATIQFGTLNAASPVDQSLWAQGSRTGTDSNVAGAKISIAPGKGTGTATPNPAVIQAYNSVASGTGAQTLIDLESWTGGTSADPTQNEACLKGTHGEQWCRGSMTELLTLSTVGLTTDTTNNLLPVDSIIESVTARITTTITTTTNWAVGDTTTAARFCSANATLTAGTTSVCLNHYKGAVSTDAAGPTQSAAAKVRITCTGANPGAGVIRITVFYRRFVAPTS